MKKIVLLLSLLAAGISGSFAQKSVPVSDTSYFSYADKQSGIPSTWSKHIYNSDCLDSVYQHYYPRTPNASQQWLYTYSSGGYLYRQVVQTYDTTTKAFATSYRNTYTYNAANQPLTVTLELPDGADWKPSSLATYHYDAAGRDTLYLYQRWDDTRKLYVNNDEVINTFDAAGRNTATLYQEWNSATNQWQPYLGFNYTFDAHGYLVSYSIGAEDFLTGEYSIRYRYVSYFGNNGLLDSSYYIHNESFFSDSTRNYFTYRPSSSVLEKTVSYIYDENRQFKNGTVAYTFYDTTGTVRTDSVATYYFSVTPDVLAGGGFISVHFRDSSQYVSRDSLTYKNFDDNPNDTYITQTHLSYSLLNDFGQQVSYLLSDSSYQTGSSSYREDHINYSLCSSVYPVTLLQFSARRKEKDALLSWQTANEINISAYMVERSTDGVHFTAIGKVMAFGNGSVRNSYLYTDKNFVSLPASKVWYRLAEQDNSGKVVYSSIVQLAVEGDKLSVSITPNPVHNAIRIYTPVAIPDAVVTIADMNGHPLSVLKVNLMAGTNPALDVSGLAKGLYLVTIQWQTGRQVLKIIK